MEKRGKGQKATRISPKWQNKLRHSFQKPYKSHEEWITILKNIILRNPHKLLKPKAKIKKFKNKVEVRKNITFR